MTDGRQPRKAARALGLLALAFLAGCQVVPKRRVAPPPPAVVSEAPPPPVTQGLPTDQQRHRVALLAPLTGPNAAVGNSIANAANMAVLDTGGALIRVTVYDTGAGAAAAAQKAIAEGNRLILGPLLAEEVRAVKPVAAAAHVPLVGFSNDMSVAGDHVYLMGYAPEQAIARVVNYAHGRGVTSIAGLVPAGVYGQRASGALLKAAGDAGTRVASIQIFDRSPQSAAAAINRLGSNPYGALLIADTSRVAASAATLARKSGGGTNARLLGTELWNTDPGLATLSSLRGAWFASVSDGLYRQLASKYRVRFGSAPSRLASLGYDSVLLVTKIAADWRMGSAFPEERLSDKGGFAGIDGAFRFGRGAIAERMLEVQQVDAGAITVVDPAPTGF
ncbi:Leucine-binding protein domain-containing protein [Sphingomonas antarctica]|uniref:penicillin-binding protein activator n=1 Tax=Sphingomonas antarctica TaxID=2040274 RepID=UPI0039EA09FF